MILILTSETDYSSIEVIYWLRFYQIDYIVITEKTKVEIFDVNIKNDSDTDFTLQVNDKEIHSSKIDAYWYRRDYLNVKLENIPNIKGVSEHLNTELGIMLDFLYYLLDSKPSISSIFTKGINKLMCLNIAKSVNLNIPETIITTSKKSLSSFKEKYNIITKTIHDSPRININNFIHTVYTERVDEISSLPDSFFHSLFQKEIDKKYELRVFYLHGEMYCMAIFSQNNSQTEIDYRKYDKKIPNRNIPFNLPNEIKKKIRKFMNLVNLNSGSLDIIYTNQNKFIFIEVNPIGQYGNVSFNCNYHLDEKVAKKLINLTHEKK